MQQQSKANKNSQHNDRQGSRGQDRNKGAALTQRPHPAAAQGRVDNTPFNTPQMQARLRSLKRQEYAIKSREDLSPAHAFPGRLRPINAIGQPGLAHINTARWTSDDISRVFSLANPIPFVFEPFGIQISSLFHLYAFLFTGGRQVTHLLATNTATLDQLVHGRPSPMVNRFAIFAYAVYCKIAGSPDLSAIAASTKAPFDYYINGRDGNGGSQPRRVYESAIVSFAYEEARYAVANNTQPELTQFFDLDYQLELEEIEDKDLRRARAMELIKQVCDPIAEKLKIVESKTKKPAAKKAVPPETDAATQAESAIALENSARETQSQVLTGETGFGLVLPADAVAGDNAVDAPTSSAASGTDFDLKLETSSQAPEAAAEEGKQETASNGVVQSLTQPVVAERVIDLGDLRPAASLTV